jgi:hypothetical protein
MSKSDNEQPSAAMPSREQRLQEIWARIEALGIAEQDIQDAVVWARQQGNDESLNATVDRLLKRG